MNAMKGMIPEDCLQWQEDTCEAPCEARTGNILISSFLNHIACKQCAVLGTRSCYWCEATATCSSEFGSCKGLNGSTTCPELQTPAIHNDNNNPGMEEHPQEGGHSSTVIMVVFMVVGLAGAGYFVYKSYLR
jgi:hypothetical protein